MRSKKFRQEYERLSTIVDPEAREGALKRCLESTLDQLEITSDHLVNSIDDIGRVSRLHASMAGILEPDRLYAVIAHGVAEWLQIERCSIMSLDPGRQRLDIRAGIGFEQALDSIPAIPIGTGICGQVALSGTPLLIENIEQDPRFGKKNDCKYSNGSLMSVPLIVEGKVRGVINVNNRCDGKPFRPQDLDLLVILATFAATALRNAELHSRLKSSGDYLNLVVNRIDTGLLAVESTGQITLMNPAFQQMFRIPQDADVRQPLTDLPSSVATYFTNLVERTWRHGNQHEVEMRIPAPEQSPDYVPAEVFTEVLDAGDNTGTSVLIIVHNLSDRQELEQLRKLDDMKDTFVATVSHELRTPLTSMLGSVKLLKHGVIGTPSSDQAGLLDIIERNSSHLHALINGLLDFSRLDTADDQIKFESVDFSTLLRDSLDGIAQLLTEKEIQLSLAIDFHESVSLDPTRIQQVLINLVGNAIKFTPRGGQIRVEAYKWRDRLQVRVLDTGCGIPSDQRLKVFDSFYQVDGDDTRKHGGAGLGLAISKKIIEMHGGRIKVTSRVGIGSTFDFYIPLSKVYNAENEVTGQSEEGS
jgi:signal transduction histidine kinase